MRRASKGLRVSCVSELGVAKSSTASPKKGKRAVKPKEPLESDIQIMILKWAECQNYKGVSLRKLIHHSPNGGSRNAIEAKKFQSMGVQSGYPDLTLNIAKGGYYGLFIELKRRDNENLSKNQEWWLAWLKNEGYYATVCKGYDEAVAVITDYLAGKLTVDPSPKVR